MSEEPTRKFYLKEFKAISFAISTYEDLNILMSHIAEGLTRSFKIKGCTIMLLDDREHQLFKIASYGISEEYLNKGPIFLDDKYSPIVLGEPVFVEDMQSDIRIQYPEAAIKENICSMLSVPIKCRKEVIGIIRAYLSQKTKFHHEDIESFSVLAHQMGVVIENNGLRNFLNEVKSAMQNLPLRMLEGI
ncbi:MAG: GAF domain-containing protein [Desulfobacterales bacterium]|nr:GAF domain-containing protein [Desulfobacterales bacterium]